MAIRHIRSSDIVKKCSEDFTEYTTPLGEKVIIPRYMKKKCKALQKKKTELTNFKNQIIKDCSIVLSLIKSNIGAFTKKIDSIIKSIDNFRILKEKSPFSFIEHIINIDTQSLIKFSKKKISSLINKSFSFRENLSEKMDLLIFMDNKKLSESFYYIDLISTTEKNPKKLKKISYESYNYNQEIFQSSTFVTPLKNSIYMFYGGNWLTEAPISVWDAQNKIFKIKKLDKINHSCGGCLVDNDVYLFGGCYGTYPISDSRKINLEKWVVKDIEELPKASYNTTTYGVDNKIFVAGKSFEKMYVYQIRTNNYNEFTSINNVSLILMEYVIDTRNNIYKIQGDSSILVGKLESKITNLNGWNVVRYKEYIYFVSDSYNLYRVNTNEDKFEKVKLDIY